MRWMERNAFYTAELIAKWFINEQYVTERDEHFGLTNLRLQKLLYYAQGVYLAMKGIVLFNDEFVKWSHGPAIPELYSHYSVLVDNP